MRIRFRVGPFDVTERLARGGMGSVWRAVHRDTGLPVAVKVVDERATDDFVRALEHEVRAMVGLDHPNLIRVFDQGRVDADAVRDADGDLSVGTPWFAMELADGGDLSWQRGASWAFVRRSLLDLLGALGHAHANGVLHRDLKPGNVLFANTPDGPVLKLSDFGMGWTWTPRPALSPPRAGGTPLYMAPEQFLGDVAQQGPWTDLYALGCLAYALVTRRAPYPRGSFEQLRAAHLERPFPALPVGCGAPDGFRPILEGLVEKWPGARWQRAADVHAALLALPETWELDPSHGPVPDQPTVIPDTFGACPPPTNELALPEVRERIVRSPPPIPNDWRADRLPPVVPPGVGLALYGLRPIPVVARDAERDLAWSLLGAVQDGVPRALVIEGPSGCGKSRLAEWLCTRAEELGAAIALRAAHGRQGAARDGLPGLVARHLRVPPGLDQATLGSWVARACEVEGLGDPDRLVELLSPTASGRLVTSAERHALVERFVRSVGRDRSVVVWLDDAQWGADALAFAVRLLGSEGLRVLIVVTLQEEALADRVGATSAAAELRKNPRTRALRLDPLAEAPARLLVRGLLELEGDLADRIADRVRGNPMFAVQLVGDWIQRELLVPGADGYRLVDGADVALPASIAQLWEQRVAALIGEHGDRWRFPLEVAAVLGPEVDRAEWERACTSAGIDAPEELVQRLVSQRLARIEPGSRRRFGFVHEMLRESVLAEGGPRLERWHLACAATLDTGEPGAEERRGRHLLAGGDWREALGPLLRATDRRLRSGQPEIATDLARVIRAAFVGRVAETDAESVELLTLEAQIHRMYSRLEEAKATALRAVEAGRSAPPALRIAGLRELATLKLHTELGPGDVYTLLDDALAIAIAAELPVLAATVLVDQGRAEDYHGRLGAARESFARAMAQYEAVGDDIGLGQAEISLAAVFHKEGRIDEAEAAALRAVARFVDSPWHLSYGQLVVAEIARARGDLTSAEESYRDVIALYDRLVGRTQTALPRVNLAVVLCATGRFPAAREELELAIADAQRGGNHNLVRMAVALRTWVCAGLGEWEGFDRALDASRELLEFDLLAPDVGHGWREAGDLARAAGEVGRASSSWALSLALWERLGDEVRARELRERLAGS